MNNPTIMNDILKRQIKEQEIQLEELLKKYKLLKKLKKNPSLYKKKNKSDTKDNTKDNTEDNTYLSDNHCNHHHYHLSSAISMDSNATAHTNTTTTTNANTNANAATKAVKYNTPFLGYFSPIDLKNIYNIPVYNKTASSRKVKVAIVIAYQYTSLKPDFDIWWKKYFPTTTTPTVNQYYMGSNSNTTNPNITNKSVIADWNTEECIDVQMLAAANPNAEIWVVEASSRTQIDLLNAVRYATNTLKADVVSCSWGLPDYNSISTATYNSYFTNPNTCYCVSSGDTNTVSWPSVLSNVISVGGTTVNYYNKLPFLSERTSTNCVETNWNSSGCGYSATIPMPSYQNSVNTQTTTPKYRCTPDISLVGNPDSGVNVYCSAVFPGQTNGNGWSVYGGTSVACPIFAGILSLAIQNRINNNKTKALTSVWSGVSGSPTDIYNVQNYLYKTIYPNKSTSTSEPTSYSNCMYDITLGIQNILYMTGTGYDIPTGLGSVNSTKFCTALLNIP